MYPEGNCNRQLHQFLRDLLLSVHTSMCCVWVCVCVCVCVQGLRVCGGGGQDLVGKYYSRKTGSAIPRCVLFTGWLAKGRWTYLWPSDYPHFDQWSTQTAVYYHWLAYLFHSSATSTHKDTLNINNQYMARSMKINRLPLDNFNGKDYLPTFRLDAVILFMVMLKHWQEKFLTSEVVKKRTHYHFMNMGATEMCVCVCVCVCVCCVSGFSWVLGAGQPVSLSSGHSWLIGS